MGELVKNEEYSVFTQFSFKLVDFIQCAWAWKSLNLRVDI